MIEQQHPSSMLMVWYSRLAYKSRDGTGGRVSAFCRLKPESGRFVRIQLCWADCEGLPANTNTRGGSQIHPPAIVEPRQALPLSQHATDSAGRAGGGRGAALALQTLFIHSFDSQVSVFFLFPALLILFVVSFHLKTETAERFRPGLWAPVPEDRDTRESSQIIDDLDVGI